MDEKRKFLRFDVILDAIFKARKDGNKAKVKNFSRDGLLATTEKKLNKGDNIEIELLIPGDNVPIITNGEIAWSEETEKQEDKHHVVGVKLGDMKIKDRNRVLNYIYDKMLEQEGIT